MYARNLLIITLICATASGCTTNAIRSANAAPQQYIPSTPPAQESLFAGDAQTLSDAQIARILEYDYAPPTQARIAVLDFGRNLWHGWSPDVTALADEFQAELTESLVASAYISDAAFLPSVLVPEKRTVPFLREAAARYQADLLLVYRSQCRSFEKYRFLKADQSRSVCGIEAVLLDVRSGLVPIAANSSRRYQTQKQSADLNFREAQLRSQLKAINEALLDVATEITQFLSDSR